MDTTNAVRHWNNWFPKDQESFELTSTEEQFIAASIGTERRNWVGTPDIGRMEAILVEEPEVLDRIGSVLLHRLLLNRNGCGPAVKFMLDHGIALELEPTEYNNFFDAVYMGAMDVARTVFESGQADATGVSVLKPHVGWPDNTSMLFWAATSGLTDMVKLLLEYGAGIHHELPIKGWGEKGSTSLQVAAAPGWSEEEQPKKHEVARILIEDGAYYDIYTACGLNDTDRLRELIDEDAEIVDATNDYGMTPLHWAARAGSMECAELLLERGPLVNLQNKARRTPLQLAAEADRADIIRLLARHGADLNTQDRKGRTPLHRATYEGCVEAAEALLEAGADPTVLNKNGKTAFEIARKDAKYFKQRA
ncbi:MAG: ankyrin repeat domain-containing protein [Chloroflexota bacterium]|nr:ankyrin repeat domain-containing protein [Chloroflexota bacterium]